MISLYITQRSQDSGLFLDIHKPFKYPSTPNPTKIRETFKIPVASYVEYPSEVLQKTTNFETEGKVINKFTYQL